ncbi:MAG: hypothetical protein ABIS69_09090, partial [Sediminibacterium sp.]
MGFSQLFTDAITKVESILIDNPISNPVAANNFQKTKSNVNQVFKLISAWNDQIDTEIQSMSKDEKVTPSGFILKCPTCLLEFELGDGADILGGVTQYMNARLYFHLYSDQLNSPNGSVLDRKDSGDFMDLNLEIFYLRDLIKSNFLGLRIHNSSPMMSCVDTLDYKHNTITKYVIGFTFCFNDDKGSIYDPKSIRFQTVGKIDKIEIAATHFWISGKSYSAITNVIYLNIDQIEAVIAGWYMCLTSNNDAEFTPSKWQRVALWYSG